MRWVALVALAACSEHGSTPSGGDGNVTVVEVPATPNADLDLLFVIDDSNSTAEIQNNLGNNFQSFVEVLETIPGGLPNLHLGVVTSDMGTSASTTAPAPPIGQIGNGGCSDTGKNGTLQTNGAPVTGTFISDVRALDGTRQRNYTGTLADAFSVMALVGAGGCGFEQPFRAARAALENNPANAGFLRVDALLGIVFLQDEDDCSATSASLFNLDETTLGPLQSFRCTRFGVTCAMGGATPDEMNQVGTKTGCGPNPASTVIDDIAPLRDFLVALKGDPHQVLVAGIAGTPEPVAVELRAPPGGGTPLAALGASCSFTDAQGLPVVADPAVRLKAFLDLFPDTSAFSTVCQQDLSGALGVIGQIAANATGSPCLRVALPPEPDCIAEDVVGTVVTVIPPCGAATCWRIENDASCLNGQKLVVDRAVPPDPATVTRLRCATGP